MMLLYKPAAYTRVHEMVEVHLVHALRIQALAEGAVQRKPDVQLSDETGLPKLAIFSFLRHYRVGWRDERGLDSSFHGFGVPSPCLLLPS